MLRFSGKCGESARPQWSDWHGTARKKEVAETAKDGNAFEILLTDFSCTMVAHSGFVFKFCCGIVLHFRVCNGCVSKGEDRKPSTRTSFFTSPPPGTNGQMVCAR